jgi:NAD(P) transhydrogenase subunit alpha
MSHTLGIPRESAPGENRVALTPELAKKLVTQSWKICFQTGAGSRAGFPDSAYADVGVNIVKSSQEALACDVVWKIQRPSTEELGSLKRGATLACLLDPYREDDLLEKLAGREINTLCLEFIPRTSRAQSMDVLSSQANIAGYRAVIEAARLYPRFFPMLMTSAGSAKAAKVTVLGAGVAGLQAIATARRLGATVEAFDVRAEAREQILSLGAKSIDISLGEEGSGQGGYAKELSEEARKKLNAALAERLKKADIIISTAAIPGRKAPVLIPEDTVKAMRPGSVIVDLAAATGGNCPLTVANEITEKHGVTLVGLTHYPSMLPADASGFFSKNLINLLALYSKTEEQKHVLFWNLEDDIIAATLVTHQGQVRWKKKG